MHSIRYVLAAVCVAMATLSSTQAASVLPLYLDELADTSAIVFEGTCTGNRTELDPATQLVVTYTTFEVLDVLKGQVQRTHVIKQIGGSLPDQSIQYRVDGIPAFTVGEDYVVFLAGVSSAGFSSPIGLAQGRFSIKASEGARKVTNGRDFKDMTVRMAGSVPSAAAARMKAAPDASRDMDLQDFKQAVRGHLQASPPQVNR